MVRQKITPSLTFVVPVYNSESMIREALKYLVDAIKIAKWDNADILVVNDGSTDETASVVREIIKESDIKISLYNQKNLGRLQTSINGTKRATGEFISFIGGRVYMQPESLVFLKKQISTHPERRVWNCHIEIQRKKNLQAQFWYIITYVTWYRYLRSPRLLSYNIDDFDYYPKGTGGFICPRDLLLNNYDKLSSIYNNPKYSADDTTLIRNISREERIYMSPEYAADYISRSSFSKFVRHTYDRGVFLLDSYMRPGTRLFIPILGYFLLTPFVLLGVVMIPGLLLLLPIILLFISLMLIVMKAKLSDIVGFCVVLPFFSIVYSVGLWKGLFIILFSKIQMSK